MKEENTIDTITIYNPEELLLYYIYKYNLDVEAKKERLAKEDVYFINKYSILLGIIKDKEVIKDV